MADQLSPSTLADTDEPQVRWQQQKSARTRQAILEAAAECLIEKGYSGLTTVEIIARAKVSRGAMHHHFSNRAELLSGLIDFILHRRLERFLADYIAQIEGSHRSDAVAVATEVHWASLKTPEFNAYLELLMAARTDVQLADLLIPATRAFETEWMNEMKRAMPQVSDQPEAMLLANDLASAMHLGLLLNSPFIENDGRKTAVKNRLIRMIESLYRDEDG
jgi:AcrR family transcriptional regulator